MLLAMALGVMCSGQTQMGVQTQQDVTSAGVQDNMAVSLNHNKRFSGFVNDMESKFVSMDLDDTFEHANSPKQSYNYSKQSSAKLMTKMGSEMQGPLSGLMNGLIEGKFTHLTSHLSK
jgi:hypothetical protein